MTEITPTDIIRRFKEYSRNKGYNLKVAGRYAYRNEKFKLIEYLKYNKETDTISVHEEGVGRYKIPFIQVEQESGNTFQSKLKL